MYFETPDGIQIANSSPDAAVKSLAQSYTVPGFEAAQQPADDEAAPAVVSQTTIIQDGDKTSAAAVIDEPPVNGNSSAAIAEDAANTAAANQWANNDLSISQEWVDVKAPANPTEVEAGNAAQSWADDQPESVPEVSQSKYARLSSSGWWLTTNTGQAG